MTAAPTIIRTRTELTTQVDAWRCAGLTVGLVPTMGALHAGHLSLVDEMAEHVDKIVVSIFVNPTQFGEGEDLDTYPRMELSDQAALAKHPADLIYAPTVAEMYPDGTKSDLHITGVTDDLEGAKRPGHFDGMATVVNKLFNHVNPDTAIFGEKDYQQLLTIKHFVAELGVSVEIIAGKIVREHDGLAMSSRNAYLRAEERVVASKLNVILTAMVKKVEAGGDIAAAESVAATDLIAAGFASVDYITVRDATTLAPITTLDKPARALAVARIGSVRLLDNMAVTVK